MRNSVFACSVLGAFLASTALGQMGTRPLPQPSPNSFADLKAHHVARLKEQLACVEAATTVDAMRACRPQMPGGHMGGDKLSPISLL